MLAQKGEPFDSEDWIFEIKWDGTRAIMFYEDGKMLIQNRRLLDITYRYPELKPHSKEQFIVDGEIVMFEKGKPSFPKLMQRESLTDLARIKLLSKVLPVKYIVFDVLEWEGENVEKKPLEERKEILEHIEFGNKNIILCKYIRGRGKALFENVVNAGLEGVMAKKLGTPYIEGKRVDFWLKIKKKNEIDAVVVGYTVKNRELSSLILAENGRYIGCVGSGIDERTMLLLKRKLDELGVEKPAVEVNEKLEGEVVWVKPELVVEVEYMERTPEGMLRFPRFRRIREDKGV